MGAGKTEEGVCGGIQVSGGRCFVNTALCHLEGIKRRWNRSWKFEGWGSSYSWTAT